MTIALIAVAVACGATAVLALALLRGRAHAGAGADERLTAAIETLAQRIDGLAAEVTERVGVAAATRERERHLLELGGTIDLDEVVSRTLDAASSVPGAEAALVSAAGPGGERLVAATGLDEADAARASIGQPPDGRRPRAVVSTYVPASDAPGSVQASVAVPLGADDEDGFIAVYARGTARFEGAAVDHLVDVASRAAPALENARRFREARRLADMDALTGLHNRRFFHDTLAREVARAHRYRRSLGLMVLDLDEFKAINDRIGHLAGDSVLAEAAERVRDVVRTADIACRVGGDEFAIILPESALEDTRNLYVRLVAEVTRRPIGQSAALGLSAGGAELRAGDDAVSLFERADGALYKAKRLGRGRFVGDDELEASDDAA